MATSQPARRTVQDVLSAIPPEAIALGELFAHDGFELALVGGPVRDLLLNRPVSDLDFATSASPEQTQQILSRWGASHWDIGKLFGTIGAKRHGLDVEVTTYRSDEYDPDSRKPHVTFGSTLDGDLSRRDLTINAMAIRIPEMEFVDPFEGLADLVDRVLRTPVAPEQSFTDDPLRMLRVARFASQLSFHVDESAWRAITQLSERITIVSAERVHAEFVKLVLGENPRAGLEVMVETGLADRVIPELPTMKLEIDEHHRHKDVYEHSLTVLDQAIASETDENGPVPAPDLVLRLAALLHDIGKPATRRFVAGGGVSFHHHEVVGAKMAARRMKAMRFDKETIRQVTRLIELHLRFHGYGDGGWTDSAVRRYVTDAGQLLERLHRLTRSDCTTRNRRKAERLSFAYDDLERRIATLQAKEELASIRPDLDGAQIMTLLGIEPGREVGEAYRFLLDLRMERGPLGEEAAEEALRAWWAARG